MPPSPPTSITQGRMRGQGEREGEEDRQRSTVVALFKGRHQTGGVRLEGCRRGESVTGEGLSLRKRDLNEWKDSRGICTAPSNKEDKQCQSFFCVCSWHALLQQC
ncbi:hypothetical protein ILYODFUR_000369 [Ilyodon furcidens]|uniref:Uncharacterized protein n=1 Tax=Ilyodon furcidens TaxID=33524 RepID=A0ABV0UZ04_9TELE